MKNVKAEQINLANVSEFKKRLQNVMDQLDHITNLEADNLTKREKLATMLNEESIF